MKPLLCALLIGSWAFARPASAADGHGGLRELLTATRLRAHAFAKMASLPRGPGAFDAAKTDLDAIARAAKSARPAGAPEPPESVQLRAALARAEIVVENPASGEDLASALDAVADAGDRLLASPARVAVPLPPRRPVPLPPRRPADLKAERARR
ncbi:MAG: hypothetical protein KGM24_04800, partial [Elusimicrobia bacterium]|nr:hypothetical protein [Elusimicrobiota bacterium]